MHNNLEFFFFFDNEAVALVDDNVNNFLGNILIFFSLKSNTSVNESKCIKKDPQRKTSFYMIMQK